MTQPRFGADAIVASLKQHGADKVFGIPGAKIDRLFEKLEHEPGAPELIVTRHEQNAAFMAQAYARLTDKTGVVVATSGPGVGNLATGLMTAQAEGGCCLSDWWSSATQEFATPNPPKYPFGPINGANHQLQC